MTGTSRIASRAGDVSGAFSDGAILFPLMAALVLQAGMDGAVLMATAGLAYMAAGLVFCIPMPVQPLKSVVVAALAIGASGVEISVSGALLGLACLALSFGAADRLAARVPRHLVHGLQLALGVLLICKGLGWGLETAASGVTFAVLLTALGIFAWLSRAPILGWLATAGLLWGLIMAGLGTGGPEISPAGPDAALRPSVILALLLPQLALTLTNSVVGTHDVAHRYFGREAERVTPSRLLRAIGIGNLLAAPLGGLPHCHGSGGLTAHVKGGARTARMNTVIGGVLLALAACSGLFDMAIIPAYPRPLMALLVFATGAFHLRLAAPSWRRPELRWSLILMAATAFFSQNMLWVLAAGIAATAAQAVWQVAAEAGE